MRGPSAGGARVLSWATAPGQSFYLLGQGHGPDCQRQGSSGPHPWDVAGIRLPGTDTPLLTARLPGGAADGTKEQDTQTADWSMVWGLFFAVRPRQVQRGSCETFVGARPARVVSLRAWIETLALPE